MTPDPIMRVRFAPSPTGQLHVGNARTALFNWLLARGSGGTFILRIEDTDVERSTRESERAILEDLRWMGLEWDEGVDDGRRPRAVSPVGAPAHLPRARRRADVARPGVSLLLSCRSSSRRIATRRSASGGRRSTSGRCRDIPPDAGAPARRERRAGRHPLPRARRIARSSSTTSCAARCASTPTCIGDPVLVRSDGVPAYNYAVVIDDALMEITHVIRGEDHISNTPRQMLLYEAFGWTPPAFAHVSLVMGPDHSPLSKRHGATSVAEFRARGYLPEALTNYLALIGWSPGEGEELAAARRAGAPLPARGRRPQRRACSTSRSWRG